MAFVSTYAASEWTFPSNISNQMLPTWYHNSHRESRGTPHPLQASESMQCVFVNQQCVILLIYLVFCSFHPLNDQAQAGGWGTTCVDIWSILLLLGVLFLFVFNLVSWVHCSVYKSFGFTNRIQPSFIHSYWLLKKITVSVTKQAKIEQNKTKGTHQETLPRRCGTVGHWLVIQTSQRSWRNLVIFHWVG